MEKPGRSTLPYIAVFGALSLGLSVSSPAQEPAPDQRLRQISIQLEWVEVPHQTCTKLLLENVRFTTNDLRSKLAALVDKGEATILETVLVTTRSGQRAKAGSYQEYTYPVAFTHAGPGPPEEVETDDTVPKEEAASSPVPVYPSKFETRDVGSTLEVDPVIGTDGKTIDLNLAPELVYQIGEVDAGSAKAGEGETFFRQPIFYTAKLTTSATCNDGDYLLLGTVSPPDEAGKADFSRKILVFVRPQIIFVGAPAEES